MLALLAGAALACLIGLAKPPTLATHATGKQQALDVVRLVTTTALALTMVLGPGIAVRALSGRAIRLAFLPLFGIGLLALTGCFAWCMYGAGATEVACAVVVGPVLAVMLGILLTTGTGDLLTAEERRTLLLVGIPVGLAISRSFLFYGPVGELNAGEISRTLVAEPRPDSHISYTVAEMVAHGTRPYGPEGLALFAPYTFASRGPLAGIASAPIMLLSGGHPIFGVPNQTWEPFDPEGFMAYRVVMIVMNATALITLWQLIRGLAGRRAARLAVLLGISTPFVFAELVFTWPKLLAASLVLLAALWLFERKPVRAGVSVAVGYLIHPAALLGYFALGPLALWPLRGGRLKRPQVRSLIWMLAGTATIVVVWLLLNHGHNGQESFFDYLGEAGPDYHPSVGSWITFRLTSLADTLVPFYLPIFEAHHHSINLYGGISPGVVHWFIQYWTGVPFGFAILFFPLLLVGLWRFARRRPWPFVAVVAIPFLAFWIYWGNGSAGLPREGLQAWMLALIGVLAVDQTAEHFSWLRSRAIRTVLVLRGVEVLAAALGATVGTRSLDLLSPQYRDSDAFALLCIALFTALMLFATWWETRPGSMLRPVAENADAREA